MASDGISEARTECRQAILAHSARKRNYVVPGMMQSNQKHRNLYEKHGFRCLPNTYGTRISNTIV